MKPDEDGTWARYDFDEATSLWVNTAHEEALQNFSQILNREKKAIDFAQTFAQRNALKHLSGLQKSKTGDTWTLQVICWRPTSNNLIKWDPTRYANAQKALESVAEGNQDALLIESGTDYISDEPDVMDELQDPEDQVEEETETKQSEKTIDIEPEPVQDEIPLGKGPAVEDPVFKQLRAAEESVPELVEQAKKDLGIKEIANAKQAKDVLARANTLADG